MKFVIPVLAGLLTSFQAFGQVEIHKCATDDGSIVYQQLPCAPEASPPGGDDQAASESPPQAPADPGIAEAAEAAEAVQLVDQRDARDQEPGEADDVAACKQQYRDAIDRIDVEIRDGIAADELEEFREQARALSQALSRC